jgi:hypothetical protein
LAPELLSYAEQNNVFLMALVLILVLATGTKRDIKSLVRSSVRNYVMRLAQIAAGTAFCYRYSSQFSKQIGDRMEFHENVLGLIGNTPLVRLNRLAKDVKANVFAKMENLNPGYSVKDRIGIAMIEAAERTAT